MDRDGLLIGEVAKRTGASRKALRLYEEAGILPTPRRSAAGYRIYGQDTVAVLAFVRQAQRLGFSRDEIKEIVGIRRAGRVPCPHVRELIGRKANELDLQLNPGGGADMENIKMSLCPSCVACPEIEIAGDEVRIGEAGNLAVLKRDEWNVLVDLIQSEQLSKL